MADGHDPFRGLRDIGFSSASCVLDSYDAATSTLRVRLVETGRHGYPHGFEFGCALSEPAAARGALVVSVVNAGASPYRHGWNGYRPFLSQDGPWTRLDEPGRYVDDTFTFVVPHPERPFRVAWYEPYDVARAHHTVRAHAGRGTVTAAVEEESGFAVLSAGDPALPAVIVLARQHPGEVMSSFFVEGFLDELLAGGAVTDRFLARNSLVVVPMMNVDGVRRDLHRTDGAGIDHNRAWGGRTPPRAVAFVERLLTDGRPVRLLADVHGDEVSRSSYLSYRTGRRLTLAERDAGVALLKRLDTPPGRHVWQAASFARRSARALVRQRRLLIRPGLTAAEFAAKYASCVSCTYELSAHQVDPAEAADQGREFARACADA
ncbi:M14-type cytosolic carboxypeptidase [Streptomyces sp. NPDC090303]|uniref:M14-type cytosolic carboxypeptidase n=1 Tax=Streptomyces sp. NPDC090303 TaxID=3365960 RepID=UPI00382132AB